MDKEDIKKFIQDNYLLMSDDEIAKKCGISYDAVRGQRRMLGLIKGRGAKQIPIKKVKIEPVTISEKVKFEQTIENLRQEKYGLEARLRESYRENEVGEAVLKLAEASIKTIPYIEPRELPILEDKGLENEVAVFSISCAHIGEIVSEEEMGGLGKYDFNTFLERAQFVEDKIVELLQQKMVGYYFKELRILGLGDFISGIIHQELLETNEFNVMEQTFKAASVFSQVILNIHRRMNIPIRFEGVVGNHGRVKKDYYFKNAYVNWDYVCYRLIQLYLSNYPKITFNILRSFYGITDIEGWKFLFFHGNYIKSWAGIPWYGISRAASNFKAVLAGFGKSFLYMVMAHIHTNANFDTPGGGEIIVNGTWKGGDEYALGALSLVADPKQQLFGVNKKVGITWRFPLYLRLAKKYDGRYKVSAYGEIEDIIKNFK